MLEDIYAENLVDSPDEDIERVVEGGAEERRDESEKGSGNEDQKNDDDKEKDKEKTKIRRKLGPRPVLNPQRLKGPRGIGIMESFFSDIKMKGKGHEREDLDLVLGRLEHWSHRLMPRMQFDDCLKKIEQLGSKKDISNFVKRIRLGMEEDVVEREEVVEDAPPSPPPQEDAFDQLMSGTTAPSRPDNVDISDEQREQMLRNRLLAEERRAARLKRAEELKAKYRAEHGGSQTLNSQTVRPADNDLSDNLGGRDAVDTNNDVIIESNAPMEAENDFTNNEEENSINFRAEQTLNSQTERPADDDISDNLGGCDSVNTNNDVIIEPNAPMEAENDFTNNDDENNMNGSLSDKLENGLNVKSPTSDSVNNSTLRQTPMEENDVIMIELNEGRVNGENDHIDRGANLENNDAHVTVLNGASLGNDDAMVPNENMENENDTKNILESSETGKNLEGHKDLEENNATSPLQNNDNTLNTDESNAIV